MIGRAPTTAGAVIGRPADGRARPALRLCRRRVFWSLVLFTHLAAVPSVVRHCVEGFAAGEYAAPVLRALILAACAAFFVLKIADLPVLRLRRDPRSILCASLIIALLHLGILEHSQAQRRIDLPARMGVVLFATGASGLGLFGEPSWLRVLSAVLRRILHGGRDPAHLRLLASSAASLVIQRAAWARRSAHGLRAPPSF